MYFTSWLVRLGSSLRMPEQSNRSPRSTRKKSTVNRIESLEERLFLSVDPLTLSNPAYWGASAAGVSGNSSSLSGDGQLVAFESDAGNLAVNDFNGVQDIFVRDMGGGTTTLISATPTGASGNAPSFNPKLSADGNFVLFESDATNLVAGDTNNRRDVFVRNLQTGTTTLVSVGMSGAGANNSAHAHAISSDGRLAVFDSAASNLVNLPTSNQGNIYVRDLIAGTTTLVSINFNNTAGGNNTSPAVDTAILSADGRFVAFESAASDLVTNDLNGALFDVFVRDLQLQTTTLVSINAAGTGTANHNSMQPTFDATGQFVAFHSLAQNLVPGTAPKFQAYVRDLVNNTTILASDEDGFDGLDVNMALHPVFSPDGRYVAYEAKLNESLFQVYARDLVTNTTINVSADQSGEHISNGISLSPVFSADGQYVYFASTATNLVAGSTSGINQIYQRNLATGVTTLVTQDSEGAPGNQASSRPVLSSDGQRLIFQSSSSNLVSGDNNVLQDVFSLQVPTNTFSLVSPRDPLLPEQYTSRTSEVSQREPTDISSDGRYVVFLSEAKDLVTNTLFSGKHVFRTDRLTGITELVSINPDGSGGNASSGASGPPAISADGRFVVFGSIVLAQVPGAQFDQTLPGGPRGIFVRDMTLGTTRVLNVNAAGFVSGLTGEPFTISPNGRYVAFATNRSLVAEDTNVFNDVYVYDLQTDVLEMVSSGDDFSTILQSSAVGLPRSIFSDDGRFLLFTSRVTDPQVPGGPFDAIFVRDLQLGTITPVSVNSDGSARRGQAESISGDGTRVVFTTNQQLVPGDTNSQFDVYIRDLTAGTTTRIEPTLSSGSSPEISHDGQKVLYVSSGQGVHLVLYDLASQTNQVIHSSFDPTYLAAISAEGQYVAFLSTASNLAPGDTNNASDVFLYDVEAQTTTLASSNQSGTGTGNLGVSAVQLLINATGSAVFFASDSHDLAPGDFNARRDIFVYTQPAGGGSLSGQVFSDTDASGTQNGNEGSLSGWQIFLDSNSDGLRQSSEPQVITASDGRFQFSGLVPGVYHVVAETRTGFLQTAPFSIRHDVTLIADETLNGLDFGFQPQFADLSVDSVTVPISGIPGQSITVNWGVSSDGAIPAVGNWQDAVYLSTDPFLDADDILLGTVAQSGPLPIGNTYSGSLVATLPALLPGNYYALVRTDRRSQVPQSTRTNDLLTSSSTFATEVPSLLIDVPATGTFTEFGNRHYFQISPPAGQSLLLKLDGLADSGAVAVYMKRGELPTPGSFDLRGQDFLPDAQLILPQTLEASTYYILVEGQLGAAAISDFILTATLPGFSANQLSPTQGGNTGQVTIRIDGTNLSPMTQAHLTLGGISIEALGIDFRDATHMYATFDLNGTAVGNYTLELSDGGSSASISNAFQVVSGVETPLTLNFALPTFYRPGRDTPFIVEVTNTSNIDVTAPLLRVTSDGAVIHLAEQNSSLTSTPAFLAISQDGPAGVLRPGQTARIILIFKSDDLSGSGALVNFTLDQPVDPNQPIPWDDMKDATQPVFMPDTAWELIWQRYIAAVGSTFTDYEALLASNATYLSSMGVQTSDPARLVGPTLLDANNEMLGKVLDADTDLALDAPGIVMDFGRINLQTIEGRHREGPLGYGWVHDWEVAIGLDSQGNALISRSGTSDAYARQPNGLYHNDLGESDVLTFVNGAFQLRSGDGGLIKFRPDGKISSYEDRNGNRITASYNTQGQLTRLNHTGGQWMEFTYDSNTGRLILVLDSAEQEAVYAYDTTGEHLVSVTTSRGVVEYAYVPGESPEMRHALYSVTKPDGTQRLFEYDSQGRLSSFARESGTSRVSITYGPVGSVTFEDSNGAQTTLFRNDKGHGEMLRDELGQITRYEYGNGGLLSRITRPDGSFETFEYGQNGTLLSDTNSIGSSFSLTYDEQFNQILTFTDPRGITTNYNLDDNGDILAAIYADGTSEQLSYNAQGDVTASISRNGDVLQYSYDDRGLLLGIDLPGNADLTYTYDTRGNLLTASDSSGTTTLQYDTADRLTRIEYPNGRFLEYSFDTQGRPLSINQNGFLVNYIYDATYRLAEVHDRSGAVLVYYEYDDLGNVILKQLGNGTYTTYEYDLIGQLLHLVNHAPDNSVNSRFDYSYDEVGRRSSVSTLEGITTYGYDLAGQLISITLPGGRVIRYDYDASGNRVRVIDNGIEKAYTTNNLNQYTAVGDATFTYDLNGNLQTRTDLTGTTTYTFNALNQLVGVVGPAGTFTYEYNALGQRSAETKNGQRQEFLIDPHGSGELVAEYDEFGVPTANYVYGLGLVGQFDTTGEYYFDFDTIGSTTGVTGVDGNYVNQYAYLPFGETTVITETVSTPFRYVGEFGVQDRGAGLLDMRARSYDPAVGQFISDDPVGLAGQDPNLRRYVGNNPVTYIDSDGFNRWEPRNYSGLNEKQILERLIRTNQCIDAKKIMEILDYQYFKRQRLGFLEVRELGKEPFNHLKTFALELGYGQNQIVRKRFADDSIDRLRTEVQRKAFAKTLSKALCHGLLAGAGVFGDVLDVGDIIWKHALKLATRGLLGKDPNDITGPAGFGDLNFTTADHTFPYTIQFENDPLQATASVQEVFVTTQLDDDLDWTTFELGDVGFGSLVVSVPPGLKEYETQVEYQNQDGSPLLVNVHAKLNLQSGIVLWTFRSLDPATGDLPFGVFEGFLPINDSTGRGEGFIEYLVHPKAGLATATLVEAQASIVFDLNEPIVTNVYVNALDVGAPQSQLAALPVTTPSNTFLVSWSGSDDAIGPTGSGIASYDVFVSDNGQAFELFLGGTTLTAANFTGQAGHTYAFYSVATDNVGYRQSTPSDAQAMTTIVVNSPPVISGSSAVTYVKNQSPVSLLPALQVTDANGDVGGGVLTLSVTDVSFGRKQKRFDVLGASSLNGLGAVSTQFVNGRVVFTVQLGANVTPAQIQSALRLVTFSTKGKGLKTSSRTVNVAVADATGAVSSPFTQSIQVLKKLPRDRRRS